MGEAGRPVLAGTSAWPGAAGRPGPATGAGRGRAGRGAPRAPGGGRVGREGRRLASWRTGTEEGEKGRGRRKEEGRKKEGGRKEEGKGKGKGKGGESRGSRGQNSPVGGRAWMDRQPQSAFGAGRGPPRAPGHHPPGAVGGGLGGPRGGCSRSWRRGPPSGPEPARSPADPRWTTGRYISGVGMVLFPTTLCCTPPTGPPRRPRDPAPHVTPSLPPTTVPGPSRDPAGQRPRVPGWALVGGTSPPGGAPAGAWSGAPTPPDGHATPPLPSLDDCARSRDQKWVT